MSDVTTVLSIFSSSLTRVYVVCVVCVVAQLMQSQSWLAKGTSYMCEKLCGGGVLNSTCLA